MTDNQGFIPAKPTSIGSDVTGSIVVWLRKQTITSLALYAAGIVAVFIFLFRKGK